VTNEQPDGQFNLRDDAEGPRRVFFYFDHYGNPQYHGAIKSTDMKTWQDISPTLSFPKGIRHGTVSMVPESIEQQIQNP
jgi:beta-galactosidase